MSTNSKSNPGYPGGSVVGFAVDDDGRPLFIFSGMSTHTQDILADPRCSVTIAAKDFKGAADGRVNLMGTCELIKDAEEKAKAKEFYLQKHPGAFWVDFGDFNWFRVSKNEIPWSIIREKNHCTTLSWLIPDPPYYSLHATPFSFS